MTRASMGERKLPENDLAVFTLQEVAELLGLTPRTVWDYVQAGKIKAKKIGGEWRITKENYLHFVND